MTDENRKYVLRRPIHGETPLRYEYYTGSRPAKQIGKAMICTMSKARGIKRYSTTGPFYQIKGVTDKQLFEMALKGL